VVNDRLLSVLVAACTSGAMTANARTDLGMRASAPPGAGHALGNGPPILSETIHMRLYGERRYGAAPGAREMAAIGHSGNMLLSGNSPLRSLRDGRNP
jgi:hypothetical protein